MRRCNSPWQRSVFPGGLYSAGLLKKCRENGICTAIEASGYTDEKALLTAIEYCDLILFDIKETDEEIHKQYTGVSLMPILENLKLINKNKIPFIIRAPIIPTLNDRESHFNALKAIRECFIDKTMVLCYNTSAKGGGNMPKFSMTKQKFINQWLRRFAKNISKDKIDKYVKDQYIWHIFSWNLLDSDLFLTGDDARRAYNESDKSGCIFCDAFGSDGVFNVLKEKYSSAEEIDTSAIELYVISEDFSWTYIKTHENDVCGPYFMRI